MEWHQHVELYNNTAIPDDLLHGTSEQCLDLCGRLSWAPGPRLQKPVGADSGFRAGSFWDGLNSSLGSLSADVDSQYFSNLFDKFVNYPPKTSTRLPTFEQQSTSSQHSSSQLRCSKCQRDFSGIKKTLEHVAGTHLLAELRPWPCVEPTCGLRFSSDKDLCRHLIDIHLGIKYTCSCGLRHRRDKHLQHIQDPNRTCKSIGPYTCGCGATTVSNRPNAVSEHIKHVTEAVFTCCCGQSHHLKDHLRHLRHQHCRGAEPYICHCGKVTASYAETGLEEHRHHVEECCLHGPSTGLVGQPRKRGRPRKEKDESTQRRTE